MKNLSNKPVFWSFRRCPFAMRARLAIVASGQTVQLREIVLKNKPDAFLSMSPKGTVPVLNLPDGTIIEESWEIMLWALGQNDPQGWLDILKRQPNKVKKFMDYLDADFKHNLDRYKYASRYDLSAAIMHRNEGAKFLIELDKMLRHTGALSGINLGIMDFASFPFIRQFRIANEEWFDAQPWSHLNCWLRDFLLSKTFCKVMHKYIPWQEGAIENHFPK